MNNNAQNINGRFFDHVDINIPENTVFGPGVSTDRAIATWDGVTGTLLRDNPNARILATSALVLDAATSFISVGVNPAPTGILRLPIGVVNFLNQAGLANLQLIELTTSGGFNYIFVGENGIDNIYIDVKAASVVRVRNAGVDKFTVSSTLNTHLQSLELRQTPGLTFLGPTATATTGAVRVYNGWTLYTTDVAGAVNIPLFSFTVANGFNIGDATLDGHLLNVGAVGDTTFLVNGVSSWVFYNTYSQANVDTFIRAGCDLDCSTNGAYLKPRRLSQALIPTPQNNELLIWHDSILNQVWLVYRDPSGTTCSVQMT